MTRPQAVPDDGPHRRRPTIRELAGVYGRELLGVLLAAAGTVGVITTVYLLGGLVAALLVISVLVFALGIILLFRPD